MPVLHVFRVHQNGQNNEAASQSAFEISIIVLKKSQRLRFICMMKTLYGKQKYHTHLGRRKYIFLNSRICYYSLLRSEILHNVSFLKG